MGDKPRKPMPISERAKQFSPFAAVAGLEKALEETEKAMLKTERRELSEDEAEKINKILLKLEKGDRVKAEYYYDGEYVTAEGKITLFDKINRVIGIEDDKIALEEIYRLSEVKDIIK